MAEEIIPYVPTLVQYVNPSIVMSMSGSTHTYLHNGHIFIARICWKKGSILLLRVMLFLDVVIAWNDLQKGFAHQPFSQVCDKCSQRPSSYFCWSFPFSFSSPSSCLWRMMKCRPGKLRVMQLSKNLLKSPIPCRNS